LGGICFQQPDAGWINCFIALDSCAPSADLDAGARLSRDGFGDDASAGEPSTGAHPRVQGTRPCGASRHADSGESAAPGAQTETARGRRGNAASESRSCGQPSESSTLDACDSEKVGADQCFLDRKLGYANDGGGSAEGANGWVRRSQWRAGPGKQQRQAGEHRPTGII